MHDIRYNNWMCIIIFCFFFEIFFNRDVFRKKYSFVDFYGKLIFFLFDFILSIMITNSKFYIYVIDYVYYNFMY